MKTWDTWGKEQDKIFTVKFLPHTHTQDTTGYGQRFQVN